MKSEQLRAKRTRQSLMEAGANLFASEGYHATSSKKIARAAGVAVGSFYNHFRDKKELLIAVYRDHVGEVHRTVLGALRQEGISAGKRGRNLVEAIIGQTLRLHTLSPEFHRQMVALRYTDPDVARAVAEEEEKVVRGLAELLASTPAVRARDVEAAARIVIAAVEEVVHSLKIASAPLAEERRMVAALSDMIHRYLFD